MLLKNPQNLPKKIVEKIFCFNFFDKCDFFENLSHKNAIKMHEGVKYLEILAENL